MNPDYYDEFLEMYSKKYFADEKNEWYKEVEKKQRFYDDYTSDDLPDVFYDNYYKKTRKNIYDLPASTSVDLKVGQLVRFREGTAAVLEGSMGIIVDKTSDEVQVMTSDDQLVWTPNRTMEVVGESR